MESIKCSIVIHAIDAVAPGSKRHGTDAAVIMLGTNRSRSLRSAQAVLLLRDRIGVIIGTERAGILCRHHGLFACALLLAATEWKIPVTS
jgi:hypothetical protein